MTDEAPAIGELVARHEHYDEIAELRESLDGVCCIIGTSDGNYMLKASDLSPAGAVKGVRIWKVRS